MAAEANKGAFVAIAAYATLWAGATGYLLITDGDWSTGVFVLAIFGLIFSALAWGLTRGAAALAIAVERPAREGCAVLLYLAFYAVAFLGFGMTAAREAVPEGREQEALVMALKLTVHVAAPALLLVLLGARISPIIQAGLSGRKFMRTFIVLGAAILAVLCVISPSLRNIAATNASAATLAWAAPATFFWVAIEAGLNEEFLFRGVVQTRLTAWFKSPWFGVVATSIIFGLVHAPGLYLRGGPGEHGWSEDPLQVAAYTIAVLSPVSLLFGLIYARTKSLLLVVLLHAMVDVLPSMAEFIRIWA